MAVFFFYFLVAGPAPLSRTTRGTTKEVIVWGSGGEGEEEEEE